MQKVLVLFSHAPHYREKFLALLGEKCDLTVIAKPCEDANLTPPVNRGNYRYIEQNSDLLLKKIGVSYLPIELKYIKNEKWDVVYSGWNLHHIARYIGFLIPKKNYDKWIWSGIFYGGNSNKLMIFLRKFLLNKSNGIVTYSSEIKEKLRKDGIKKKILSFNNSEVSEEEFEFLPYCHSFEKLNMLFVGRYQERKKLERLIDLAERNPNVNIRVVGPGMEKLSNQVKSENIKILGPAIGNELRAHMKWSHVIVNPGHLGLLVANAARYGRPIIVDKYSKHAPEVIIAKESNQLFIDWSNPEEVDNNIESLIENEKELEILRRQLYEHTKKNYTVENMVDTFLEIIK